jgi:flavin-dependent dehydrogenase
MFDITIVGAGPAGSNLARLLAQQTQLKICLIDKRPLQDEPGIRRKACGGLLSPDAQKLLASQGLTIPVSVLEDPQLFSVRTIDFDNRLENHYQRHYLNMNREKFDRFLFHLVPNWVDKRQGVLYDAKKRDSHWTLHLRRPSPFQSRETSALKANGDSAVESIQTKMIVAADGANSFLRRRFAPDSAKPKQYISLQKWYPLHASMPYYTGIFDSEVTDYYSWTIQKDDHIILGTAIPVGDSVHERFEILRQKVETHLQVPLREESRTEGAFIERIPHVNQLLWEKDGIFFVGEAAGAASPTSAEGFSYSLQSSFYLAHALSGKVKNPARTYKRSCKKIALKLLAKQVKSPAMYHLGIRKWVMKSKITAISMMNPVGFAKEDDKS